MADVRILDAAGDQLDAIYRYTASRWGEAQAERVRLDLSALACTTIEQMCLLAEEKKISLTAETAAPVEVEGDRSRLKQVIVNLLGKSSLNALLAIALAFAPGMARVTRSVALAVRKQDYVNAAIARGESAGFIVGREMLPNVVAPIIVEMTIRVAFAVMLFATLSFLGLGAQPPASEWGLMVSEARRFMHLSAWMILWPSLAVALVAIGFNLLGDGLRDALNPRT